MLDLLYAEILPLIIYPTNNQYANNYKWLHEYCYFRNTYIISLLLWKISNIKKERMVQYSLRYSYIG